MTDHSLLSPAEARQLFRSGLRVHTAGWCRDRAQANLIALPRDWAFELMLFAQRNLKPCPVLDVLEPGQVTSPIFDGDVRTDLPGYRVYRDGHLVDEPQDVTDDWDDDLVALLIGCSFTFESALARNGIGLRHIELQRTVPMYRTTVACRAAGRLNGPLVVSMRPIPADRVADAVQISGRYPAVHGAPVHVGNPMGLGITDLDRPDFGDPVDVRPGEVPVFWACGVTPQAAVMASRPPLAITHSPGQMAVLDTRDEDYFV